MARVLGIRWWLGLAFALIAGLTALVVVRVLSTQSVDAFRDNAEEFAVGNAVAAAEELRGARGRVALGRRADDVAAERGLALFLFDGDARPLTPATSNGISWATVPDGELALDRALSGGRLIRSSVDGTEIVVGVRFRGVPDGALVAYALRPELREQAGIVRTQVARAALWATGVAALVGFVIASLIARRLARIAETARRIEEGDFERPAVDRFPDEVGRLAGSIDSMRVRLRELFGALAAERDRLEELLDRLADGDLLVDADGRIAFANDRAGELLDGAEPLGGRSLDDLALQPELRALVDAVLAGERAEDVRIDADETLAVSGLPAAAEGDDAVLVVASLSERERAERAQRDFVADASHELRTPLAGILSSVEMLQTGAKDEPEHLDAFLDGIAREARRLNRLTQALLVLERADARQEPPRLQAVELHPVLERVAAGLAPRAEVDVVVDAPDGLAALAEPDLLEQALAGVAANAERATEHGSIALRARPDGARTVVEIADTGPGIPPEDAERVFEPFYRGAGEGQGFGLGLAIARRAVETLGGSVAIRPGAPRGTTVIVTLERAADST